MCEVFLGMADVVCGDAQEVAKQVESVLLTWILERDWWAQSVVTFAVDGASNLVVRGASAQQAVDVSTIEDNVFALIGTWCVLMSPMGEHCHLLQRVGYALLAAGPTHVEYKAAVDRQRALYNRVRQRKELQKFVQDRVQLDKHSGLRRIPTSHHIKWCYANARCNTAFLTVVSWVAQHLYLKVQHSTKEEDVWEDCHGATLLALVDGLW